MASVASNDSGEELKRILQDRIAQLESSEAEPPKSADVKAADESLEGASAALRAVASDATLSMDEKLRLLQSMHSDCIADVRALEYELTTEEKKLRTTEQDYSELGEDLRKIDLLTEKLKTLSRELSKQNKAIQEESERRTAEEQTKREEIVSKFDEAMRDIHSKLNSQLNSMDDGDDEVRMLEQKLDELQKQYEEREIIYENTFKEDESHDAESSQALKKIEEMCTTDAEAIQTEKKILRELEQGSKRLRKRAEENEQKLTQFESKVKFHQEALQKHTTGLEKLNNNIAELERTKSLLVEEEEILKVKIAEAGENARVLDAELEFWKGKLKSELEKRETLERLCRTLTEERTVMRKEVQAMQAAWVLLETEIENLRAEISADQDSATS